MMRSKRSSRRNCAETCPLKAFGVIDAFVLLFIGVGVVWTAGAIIRTAPDHDAQTVQGQWAAWERRLHGPMDEISLASIEAAARELLAKSPIENRALRVLALIAAARGDPERAERLMELVVSRSRADISAQSWLYELRLRRGNLIEALANLDAVLRVDPSLLKTATPELLALAGTVPGSEALATALAAAPPWRPALLQELTKEAGDPRVLLRTYFALISSSRPPAAAELNPYLDRLVRDRRASLAYLLWAKWLPHDRRLDLTWLFNGEFEHTPTGAPFDWRLGKVRGARTEIMDAQGSTGGKALRIEFLNTRVPYRHVQQMLLLGGGQYEIKGRVATESLETARGLFWAVTCANASGASIGESERFINAPRWRDFSFRIDVPERDCREQWLTLRLAARIPSEQQASGRIWLDGLKLERVAPTSNPTNG